MYLPPSSRPTIPSGRCQCRVPGARDKHLLKMPKGAEIWPFHRFPATTHRPFLSSSITPRSPAALRGLSGDRRAPFKPAPSRVCGSQFKINMQCWVQKHQLIMAWSHCSMDRYLVIGKSRYRFLKIGLYSCSRKNIHTTFMSERQLFRRRKCAHPWVYPSRGFSPWII